MLELLQKIQKWPPSIRPSKLISLDRCAPIRLEPECTQVCEKKNLFRKMAWFQLILTKYDLFTGFGGQVDFIRGAAEGFDGKGKPIIALPSVTKRNESKIVPTVKLGKNFASVFVFLNSWLTFPFLSFIRWWYCNISSSRSLCSHWIWYCSFVWKDVAAASPCTHQHLPSRSSGKFGKSRIWTTQVYAFSLNSHLKY